jgi:cysteine desulfurase
MAREPVYLDCAATTPVDPRVRDLVCQYLTEDFGNAGSRTHDFGTRARRAVEKARDQVAAVVNAGRGEVIFTSGATESNNLAILGLAAHGQRTGRRHLVSTRIEHHAVLEPLEHLAKHGFELTLISPTAGGWVEAEEVRAAVRDDTLLVSVMHVNNETGVIQPVDRIADALADHPSYLHVDAAQGFGKDLGPLRHRRIDLISLSGHKLFAPKGVGALVLRRRGDANQRPPIEALAFGGGQELGLRPGTLSVPLIAGLGLAAELAVAEAAQRSAACRAFRDKLFDALAPLSPTFNGDPSRSVPHILNVSFPGLDAEAVMEALAVVVAISNGSACTSGATMCSHVLGAMGLPADQAMGATRWSWSHTTAEPDWDAVRRALAALGHESAA